MAVVLPATATTPILFLHTGCFFLILLSFNVAAAAAAAAAASPQTSFSFNFSSKSSYSLDDLLLEGTATVNDNPPLVDLTCRDNYTFYCAGRMSYNYPVPFYDNSTGKVASFATSFTFAIKPVNGPKRGDGMAFFLSSYPSRMPPGSSGSGNLLGLINSSNTTASGSNRFVAVEFDTFANPWDPSSDHIGVDLSSVTSISTKTLPDYSLNGTMTATITFNGSTQMLEVFLHFDSNHSLGTAQLKTQLRDPLDTLLPSEVAVGFSAATGGYFELHQILSWSFNSTMSSKGTAVGTNSVEQNQGQVLSTKGHGLFWEFSFKWEEEP